MAKIEFNGYAFNNSVNRKKMRFIIIEDGNCNTNNAYAFESLSKLKKYLEDNPSDLPVAIFEVKDATYLNGGF